MISVIVPAYNEEALIKQTIQRVRQHDICNLVKEIIVVDGGSTDNTFSIAQLEGVKVIEGPKGRAKQMNQGATAANTEIIYFLHADSIPPKGYTSQIIDAYRKGTNSGCFRLKFDYEHWFLKTNAWFTRFNVNAVRFGDQSLFVTKDVFQKCGCFREDLVIMEDQEIIHRLKKNSRFTVLNDFVTTSARKYLDNGVYRMQGIFYCIWFMYYMGYSQQQMLKVHKRLICKHKL